MLLEEQRESWGTRGGFILAAVGSAVGLGNLWGFPYKLYSYGGGAFLIPYIIAMFLVGLPLLILEFSIGHYTQRAAPNAFKHANKRFEVVGWWGIILGFVIITYYPVILAYCFSFLWYSTKGIFNGGQLPWAGVGLEGVANAKNFFFDTYLGYREGIALGEIRFNIILPLLVAWLAMYFCIFKGVKLVGKIVWLTVPLPWLMLLILTVRGLTLEGSMQGLAYYLDPVWSQLARPIVWRYAFGQVFFSMSLAFGVMITYASFLHRKSDINNNAAIIGLADFATSFVAGLAVFATLGAMAFVTQKAGNPIAVENVAQGGPSLAFVAFPYALAQLPYSAWFSFIFFFALVTLGIDSAFSITESVLASVVDKTGWPRAVVLPVMSFIGLGFGLIYITKGGLNWLGSIDGFVNGTLGIAFLGLLECVVLGWLWRIGILRRHANSRSDWQLGRWWDWLIRILIPVLLGTLFFWQLFEDIGSEGGFFRAADGKWLVQNCVGIGILIAAPLLAIVFSLVRGQTETNSQLSSQPLEIKGSKTGAMCFVISIAAIILYLTSINFEVSALVKNIALWGLLLVGIFSILISNYILDKCDNSSFAASWFSRWAGIIGIINISLFAASILSGLTNKMQDKKLTSSVSGDLSGVSYIILAVVFLIIVGGLSWCFYKAITAANSSNDTQNSDEM